MSTFEIDGLDQYDYDDNLAFDEGQEFTFDEGKSGSVTFFCRWLSPENEKYTNGAAVQAVAEKGEDLSKEEGRRLFAELVHDTCIASWSTTMKSGGQPIAANRDNFVGFVTSKKGSVIFDKLCRQATQRESFQLKRQAVKN